MIRAITLINFLIAEFLVAVILIYPPIRGFLSLHDAELSTAGVPQTAWRLCQNLTPRYATWARQRVNDARPEQLSMGDISGTEWPLFGSVFYLWGIDNLQNAWEAGDHRLGVEPKVFCREAIVASSQLVIDPRHATWVKKYWGDKYLHTENVFYRMLVIGSLTTREKLLHDGAHTELLRDQVETLSRELDASPHGLLDDYPRQCFPGDVIAAVACIRRADAVLGTDHSKFAARALRGFTGRQAARLDLPPYLADSRTGRPLSEARGCGNSYLSLLAPELWPAQAARWYAIYDKFFWQERFTAVGYREFARDVPHTDWMLDVDAGPVVGGLGISASAFGVGAARKNGRFDRAFPLAAEMLVSSWELPNGVLALPRLLSKMSDAPLLGEAAILWMLSVQPEKGVPLKTGRDIPVFVYLVISFDLLVGIFLVGAVWERFRVKRREKEWAAPAVSIQFGFWALLVMGAAIEYGRGSALLGLTVLLLALMFPFQKPRVETQPSIPSPPSPKPPETTPNP